MKNFPRFQQLSDESALLSSEMDRRKQIQEFLIVFAEFFQGIFQREMPRCALSVEACRIGGQKSKRGVALLVFDQMEIDPPYQMHIRAVRPDELFNSSFVMADTLRKTPVKPVPYIFKEASIQILSAGH